MTETQGARPTVIFDLDGVLYRVGPGRYDRGPDRKRMVLDGDGMVQALELRDGEERPALALNELRAERGILTVGMDEAGPAVLRQLRNGIEQARQQNDAHAASEMSELLANLGSAGE